MSIIKENISILLAGLAIIFLSACAPEVGSEQWCKEMKEKQPGDWTANQAVDYAKHCVLK